MPNTLEDSFDTVTAHRKKGAWHVAVGWEGVGAAASGNAGEPFDVVLDRAHHAMREQLASNGAEA